MSALDHSYIRTRFHSYIRTRFHSYIRSFVFRSFVRSLIDVINAHHCHECVL